MLTSLILRSPGLTLNKSLSNLARQLCTIKRPPVVTIMGHVDHGKTTLLDQLRKSQIVKGEFGGITQHIGAFVVSFGRNKSMRSAVALKRLASSLSTSNTVGCHREKDDAIDDLVTFLDTPGHAAFAAMRQRGADVTDIVVLVIASEDGILDQTRESIKYAQNSGKPIIIALNKIDKFSDQESLDGALKSVCHDLREFGIITELDGGNTQIVKISALKNLGIEDLKENIIALADTLELKAFADCPAEGTVIESSLHPHRGKLCTVLIQQGILRKGDIVLAGQTNYAKVRSMFDEWGQNIEAIRPGFPVQIIGWKDGDLPAAGEKVIQLSSEKEAKKAVNEFKERQKLEKALTDAEVAAIKNAEQRKLYREKLDEKNRIKKELGVKFRNVDMINRGLRPKEYNAPNEDLNKEINLLLKCDVAGSLEAILDLLDTYDSSGKQLVKLNIVHYGVGPINENDFNMAAIFPNSYIYGFNVKYASQDLASRGKKEGVPMRLYNVIYHLFDDLKATIHEKMPLVEHITEIGSAMVLQNFTVTVDKKKKIHVAGSRCTQGKLVKDGLYTISRNNEIIADRMEVNTLKHLKNDVDTILRDTECGISFKNHDDLEFKTGDRLTCLEVKLVKPKLKWDLKGFN